MGLTPEEPRQRPEVWHTSTKLLLPPADIRFIQTALCHNLTVGVRLANWQPHGTACPICGQQETSQHTSLWRPTLLPSAWDPPRLRREPQTDPTVLLWEQPEVSLTTPLGVTLWSAVRAAWSQRCMHKLHSNMGLATWDQFLVLWVKVLWGSSLNTCRGRNKWSNSWEPLGENMKG